MNTALKTLTCWKCDRESYFLHVRGDANCTHCDELLQTEHEQKRAQTNKIAQMLSRALSYGMAVQVDKNLPLTDLEALVDSVEMKGHTAFRFTIRSGPHTRRVFQVTFQHDLGRFAFLKCWHPTSFDSTLANYILKGEDT